MPRNQREWAQRKIKSARGNIETCGQHLEAIRLVYEVGHPELCEGIVGIQTGLVMILDALTDFSKSF